MDMGIVIGLLTGYILGFYLIIKCMISIESIVKEESKDKWSG